MKTPLFPLFVAAAALLASGCATTTPQRSAAVAEGLQSSSGRVVTAQAQLATTIAALDDLVLRPQPDLREQFADYRTGVGRLEDDTAAIVRAAERIRERSQEYLLQWETELATITDPALRERSEERRADVRRQLTDVQTRYAEVQQRLGPALTELRDLRTFLAADLTAAGIASAREPAQRARERAVELQRSLDSLTRDFSRLGFALSSKTATALEARTWRLRELEGARVEVPRDVELPTLLLSPVDHAATGWSGVNRFRTRYELDGETLKFGDITATRRAGASELQQLETRVHGVLQRVTAWRVDNDELELLSGATVVARFRANS